MAAKYGDESRFFDLDVSLWREGSVGGSRRERERGTTETEIRAPPFQPSSYPPSSPLTHSRPSQDIENTAGSWDMYGVTDERRYPGLQAEFFQRAAAPVARREAILAFLGLAGPVGIVAWGAKGAAAVKLPITLGPQKPAALGPRDKM